MDEKITESVEAVGGQMTRSIRATKKDFDALKDVAEKLGMSQGAAFAQLLASWELHHASDTLQEQAGAVKAAQTLLAQLENLFTGQFAAMSALEAEAKRAAGAEVEDLRRKLLASREDEAAARADVEAAQQAVTEAKAAQRAAEQAQRDAEKAQRAAEQAQADAEHKRASAESMVTALQEAAADARAERDAEKADALRYYNGMRELKERADGYERAMKDLAAERAKNTELKADLEAEKTDRRKAAADLADLMKAVDGRVEAAKAEAVKVAKAEMKTAYDKKYNEAVAKIEQEARERTEQAIAAAKEKGVDEWADDMAQKVIDEAFKPKHKK